MRSLAMLVFVSTLAACTSGTTPTTDPGNTSALGNGALPSPVAMQVKTDAPVFPGLLQGDARVDAVLPAGTLVTVTEKHEIIVTDVQQQAYFFQDWLADEPHAVLMRVWYGVPGSDCQDCTGFIFASMLSAPVSGAVGNVGQAAHIVGDSALYDYPLESRFERFFDATSQTPVAVDHLADGTAVQLLSSADVGALSSDVWVCVLTTDGINGWISRDAVRVDSAF